MGNAQASPPADPRYSSACRSFASAEIAALKSLFASLAAQSDTANCDYISSTVFQAYFQLAGPLANKLFDEVTQRRRDGRFTFSDLVIAKSAYEKASPGEIDDSLYRLLDIDGDGAVTRSDLSAVLSSVFSALFPGENAGAAGFVDAAEFSERVEGQGVMRFQDFKSWCGLVPSLRKFLGSLLMSPETERPGFQVPRLRHSENLNPELLLMRKEYAWLIAGAIPLEQTEQWELLYHSSVNGLSFNTFLGSVSNGGQGPTVLLIKDNQGHVYGGYASQPWEKHGDFYGDMKCFLFQLCPCTSLYRASGSNNNFQWCAVNFGSESIPNGIGFGGRVNHFGLFVSGSFDRGQTFACSTFGSPCLSAESRICPEIIECWGVVVAGKEQERGDLPRGTVLERFKEDRHMLNMVGLANSSE